MLKKRVITAIVLILLILLSIYYLPTRYFTLVAGVFTLIGAWEWTALCGFTSKLTRSLYLVLLVVLFTSISILPSNIAIPAVSGIAIGWWMWALVWILRYQYQPHLLHRRKLALGLIGIFILLPFWFGLVTLHLHQSIQLTAAALFNTPKQHILLFIISLVVLADTAAYFVGRRWGKHKLAERVSPGKTWEGLLGAVLVILILVEPLALLFGIDKFTRVELFGVALVIIYVSLIGDLFESVIKRLAGVKDSGNILPGHGGVLDRIDSYTAAIPIFVAMYFLL